MKHLIFLLGLVMLAAFGSTARAQEQFWLQIEAQPGLAAAEDRARAYAALFPDVAGFSMRSGWFAIALGPYLQRDAAEDQLGKLKREGLIPRDSFIAEAATLGAPFFPQGLTLTPPAAVPEVVAEPAPPVIPPVIPMEETPEEARAAEAALSPEARQELQTALQWFGFYAARIDGAFGPGTRKSMAAWQEANGLEPTGILTTAQRDSLLAAYETAQAALGLQLLTEEEAGIEITLPTALVEFDHYEPPFVHYRAKGGSGVKVILISQPGDQSTLYGLYDVLQTLEDVPLDGPRSRSERSFTIDGRSPMVASHSYVELSKGLVKGYMLVWDPRAEDGMDRVLAAMQASFRSVGDKALDPGLVPMAEDSRRGLLSGLEVRRPEFSRSGFYVDAGGAVLTTREAVEGCNRVTLDLRVEADVVFSDAATGLALLKPRSQLSPPAVAALLSGQPRIGQEVAVSGYSYGDTLPAPTLTYGALADVKGLDGEAALARLEMEVLPGDAGGPVLDGSGAVIGMLLPRDDSAPRKLPASVSHALQAAALAPRLAAAGITPRAAESKGALAPEDLSRLATGMTVLVSCW
ncbi:Sporulation related domain-containing protein [Gemmobacter aquatilis]|uniref:Sporulation related domain-containing protein n=1 Tax=Gemmobacter aquatilis TaxID=933059 RepID=A0A1H8CN63_9RHOB|nr:Sporulation related domain-containing protein [Gemmobacter aquatilis]